MASVFPSRAERMIALRFLRTRETDGFISFIAIFSLIGVALGVATLIVVLSVMNGFRGELFNRILGMNGHIQVVPEKGVITGWETLAQRLAVVPFVMSVEPIAERQTMLTADGATRPLTLRGVRPQDLERRDIITKNLIGGSLAAFNDKTNTALTYQLPPIIRRLRQDHPDMELLVTNTATRVTVENVLQNRFDLGLVTLPVDDTQLRVTPLRHEMLVAILPAGMPDIPDRVTPDYAVRQPLVLEHAHAAVYGLTMRWLSKHLPLQRTPMHLGTIEAMKSIVELGLGMALVPDGAIVEPRPGIVVRPVDPPVPCTMALIEHRSKPSDPALDIVRNALCALRTGSAAETPIT